MELTQGSETSANYNLTPEKYPKEHIQYSNHGENLKSGIVQGSLPIAAMEMGKDMGLPWVIGIEEFKNV